MFGIRCLHVQCLTVFDSLHTVLCSIWQYLIDYIHISWNWIADKFQDFISERLSENQNSLKMSATVRHLNVEFQDKISHSVFTLQLQNEILHSKFQMIFFHFGNIQRYRVKLSSYTTQT